MNQYYEVTDGVVTKYYYAGAQRIAMRKNGTLNYILGDHLGSTSIVTNAAGALVSQQLYTPWGETRYSSGLSPTQYQYTGQYSYTADFGLMYYNARWYDPALGRFAQADSIVPPGVQGLDRYAYVNNNPMRYTDPTGHMCREDGHGCDGSSLQKTKIDGENGPRMVNGNSRKESKDYAKRWKDEQEEAAFPTVPSHAGYSDPDLDALYSFWENAVNPINDLVGLDDIYRISNHGGWKAARFSLNLQVGEAIVQGSRQAYRDSWYQTLTPGQRALRALTVGTEALITDTMADKTGKGYRYAGFLAGGPLGAAGGDLAGNTFATNVMDGLWEEKINPFLFSKPIFGGLPQ